MTDLETKNYTTLATVSDESTPFGSKTETDALLVAFAPVGTATTDRIAVGEVLHIGRSSKCKLSIRHSRISKRHARISRADGGCFIEDLGSTNGTFVDGERVFGRTKLESPAVIRVGPTVLVFHKDASRLLQVPGPDSYGLAGQFHTESIIGALRETAISKRHVLLTGPSGTGKELAARALSVMKSEPGCPLPLVVHNAAQFASDEEASTTLFGVGPRVFSGVDARTGLIEQADGGVFFLDEAHSLSVNVQRSLLRVIEDGFLKRIGETKTRQVDVSFVLATNVEGENHGLTHDLFARLRCVELPPLKSRVADIPSIFEAVLTSALARYSVPYRPVLQALSGDHFEALCLDGFSKENVRGLVDLADRLATRIRGGAEPAEALRSLFLERYHDGPVATRSSNSPDSIAPSAGASLYESNKPLIVSLFHEHDGNVSAIERALKRQGLTCSRRWLTKYFVEWGLRRK